MKEVLKNSVKIDGYHFSLSEDKHYYDCRGEVMYDDEHDEMPEPGLWNAAHKLAEQLKENGFPNADYEHSEKGWVEVTLN